MMTSDFVADRLRRPYARIIMPDDQGRYAAKIAEFPGCFAEGDTPEEAYRNLERAAESWVASALEQGMEIPGPSATQGYSGMIRLRVPKSIHKRAAEYARQDGVSLNQFFVSAIAHRVGAEDFLSTLADRLAEVGQIQNRIWMRRKVTVEEEAMTAGSPADIFAPPTPITATTGEPLSLEGRK